MEIQARVVLLVVGIVIIIGVAADFIRKRRPAPRRRATQKNNDLLNTAIYIEEIEDDFSIDDMDEPIIEAHSFKLDPEEEGDDDDLEPEIEYIAPTTLELPPEKPLPTNLITITILSRHELGFNGNLLFKALEKAHFHFGGNDIFYQYENESDEGEVLFRLVKAVEPGYFYIDEMRSEMIPGITFIFTPDNVTDPDAAFDKLIRIAKQISFVLNGELLDHNRQALTLTTIDKYREKIKAA